MTDLNSASIEEFATAGIEPDIARAMMLWGPYRSWEGLPWVSEVDDAVMVRLKATGFTIASPYDAGWARPKPFRISASASM